MAKMNAETAKRKLAVWKPVKKKEGGVPWSQDTELNWLMGGAVVTGLTTMVFSIMHDNGAVPKLFGVEIPFAVIAMFAVVMSLISLVIMETIFIRLREGQRRSFGEFVTGNLSAMFGVQLITASIIILGAIWPYILKILLAVVAIVTIVVVVVFLKWVAFILAGGKK